VIACSGADNSNKIMAERFPILYLRGYAMTRSQVQDTFNKPYYGFNLGATQVRQGRREAPMMRIFESPVVRLLKDERYVDSFNRYVDAVNRPLPDSVGADWRRTLWVFRFYDEESTLGGGRRREIEDYAAALAQFLDAMRRACGNPDGFAVNLVAHSMGGLIARCYLQNDALFRRAEIASIDPVRVNKLFTYGTPHRGISFRPGLGWVEDIRDLVGPAGADSFGARRMREFLGLDDAAPLHAYRPLPHAPPAEKVMCMIGTNYSDYDVWAARKSVGPGSDGMVVIENAYVQGAPRAFIHRAHSGPFGLVNSEAGYQNLSRFLFGDFCYALRLLPLTLHRHLPGLEQRDRLDYLLIETGVVIRGLAAQVQQRRADSQSAVVVEMQSRDGGHVQRTGQATHLYTGHLRTAGKMRGARYLRAALDIRIEPHYRHTGSIRGSRFEREALFADRLHFGIRAGGKGIDVHYRWASSLKPRLSRVSADGDCRIPLPVIARRYLGGDGISLRVTPWS